MNLENLKGLVEKVNHNEDVLTKKSIHLRDEIRDWCMRELFAIESEEKKILDFVNTHLKIFNTCRIDNIPRMGEFGLDYTRNGWNEYTKLQLSGYMIHRNYEEFYNRCTTKLLVSNHWDWGIDFWTKMKDVIDFRKYQLNQIPLQLQSFVNTVIAEQKNRMDKIVKVCGEIDDEENNAEEVEIKITIKKV